MFCCRHIHRRRKNTFYVLVHALEFILDVWALKVWDLQLVQTARVKDSQNSAERRSVSPTALAGDGRLGFGPDAPPPPPNCNKDRGAGARVSAPWSAEEPDARQVREKNEVLMSEADLGSGRK